MPTNEILTLEIEPPYIGSAVSPTVDIDETTDDITVTITDFRGEHSYTVEKTDQAIEDAEQAAQNANDTAQTVAQGWASKLAEINGTLAQQREQMGSAATAESQRVTAENARVAAENAREQEWNELSTNVTTATSSANEAAGQANTAAQGAIGAANAADDATTRANNTITGITQTANQIFAQAGQATENANAAAQSANTAATNANTKAGLADTAAQNADTATTAANNAAQTATTAAEQADAAREAIQDDLAAKADKDGYYQQLTAGLADTVAGGTTEIVQFAQRTSDHDGMVRVESLRGNTVRWNQLVPNNYMITANSTIKFTSGDKLTSGHKYLLKSDITITSPGTSTPFIALYMAPNGTTERIATVSYTNSGRKYTFFTSPYDGVSNGTDSPVVGNFWLYDALYSAVATITNTCLFDLTTAFGAGNEPQTVEEFERMYPEDYYPYDAGSLLSVNIEGIESAGIVREIPPSTLFPDGILRSAGAAYDERTPTRDIKRVGSVDLGTLNWLLNGTYWAYWAGISDAKKPLNDSAIANITSEKYPSIVFNAVASTIGIGIGRSGYVLCNNGSTTDKPSGTLYYELATPTEAPIDPPLNLAYPTEQGGTESIVVPTGSQSAAPTMAMVYAYNADGVRDLSQAIIATIEGSTASANYAIGGYFVHAGKLYKATSAIATGETINPGTNCTATTVMAEIVRLTA